MIGEAKKIKLVFEILGVHEIAYKMVKFFHKEFNMPFSMLSIFLHFSQASPNKQ